MKIHFDNVDLATRTGPSSFANRLARRLFESGHEVCTTSFGADASLVFIERSGADVADIVVQRLDGIWFKPNEFQNRNTGIKRLYESADAVIWQSNFDSEMTKRWWGVPRRGTVIHNGVDVSVKHEITIPVLAQLRNVYDRIFVCSANWHAQKRLIDNVNLFQTQLKYHPKSCLIIMGNNPDVRIASPNVYYTGSLEHDACLQVYAISNWMFHLAWCDHCPNVVCEALSQGTPVVCASSGGTKELIGSYGKVLCDEPYDYELYDYDSPPRIDVAGVGELPDRKELNFESIADIDINNVAKKYVQLFESLIQK
jgi:glycosyltransferase involved in cell wall biosynthesis